jgi:hypothetical protein
MDVVRFAETKGHEYDYEIDGAWRYRDWLIHALNADLPFDDFVREQICGDLIQNPRLDPATGENESRIGTIFWNLGESATSPVDLPNDEGDRIGNEIDVLGRAFLGMTVGCARCHDHKTEPISQRDYYGLFGILANTQLDRVWTNAPKYTAAAEKLREIRSESDKLVAAAPDAPVPPVAASGRVFADFSTGVPEGWQLVGDAEVVTMPDVTSAWCSAWLVERLARAENCPRESALRSSGSILGTSTAWSPARTRRSSSRSITCRSFRDPIYDDLRRRIDRAGEWQVHRIRASKWLDQPAYLEVFTGRADLLKTTATERQQFGIRSIIFSDGPQTAKPRLVPTAPSPPTVDPRSHELAWEALAIERDLPLPEYYCGVSEPEVGWNRSVAKRGDAKTPETSCRAVRCGLPPLRRTSQ